VVSRYGEIENVKVATDAEGASRKFGFVCYKTEEDAKAAVHDSTLLTLKQKQIYVAAQVSADRRKQQSILKGQAPGRGPTGAPVPPMGQPPQMTMGFDQARPAPYQPMPLAPPQIPFGAPASFGPAPGVSNAKDRLKAEVLDKYPDGARRNDLLAYLRDMSEEQAANLTKDQGLLGQWLDRP
jgi:hypothetical protein